MMIYASVYPEKFEGDKALKLMQVNKLWLMMYVHYMLLRMNRVGICSISMPNFSFLMHLHEKTWAEYLIGSNLIMDFKQFTLDNIDN